MTRKVTATSLYFNIIFIVYCFTANPVQCKMDKPFDSIAKDVPQDSYDTPAGFWTETNKNVSIDAAVKNYGMLWDVMKQAKKSRTDIKVADYGYDNWKIMRNIEEAVRYFIQGIDYFIESKTKLCGNGKSDEALFGSVEKYFYPCQTKMGGRGVLFTGRFKKVSGASKEQQEKWVEVANSFINIFSGFTQFQATCGEYDTNQ